MLSYHVLPTSVVLNFDGKTVTIHSMDARYNNVIEAIKNDDLESIPDLVDVEKKMRDAGMDYKDGLVYLNAVPMPEDLHDRIEEFVSKGLPTQYLNKFWDKLKKNPSVRARKMLFKFLEHNGHPITPEGNFIAYRGVRSDFRDSHTGKFDNSPGSICSMPRHLVDDDPNNTCSSGLHVACYSYAKGFSELMIEVEVDPADVVCVPNDYDGTKMRVSKFKVIRECEAILDDGVYNYDEDDQELSDEVVGYLPSTDLEVFEESMRDVADLLGVHPSELTRDEWLGEAIENDLPRLNKVQLNKLGGFRKLKNSISW